MIPPLWVREMSSSPAPRSRVLLWWIILWNIMLLASLPLVVVVVSSFVPTQKIIILSRRPKLNRHRSITTSSNDDDDDNPTKVDDATGTKERPTPPQLAKKKKKTNKTNKPRSNKVQNNGFRNSNNNNNYNNNNHHPPLLLGGLGSDPPSSSSLSPDEPQQHYRLYEDRRIVDDCLHYDVCSGCSMGSHFAVQTRVVRAAQRYFGSERYDSGRSSSSSSSSSNGPDTTAATTCYPLIMPTPTTQWRTQAKLAVAPRSSSKWRTSLGGVVLGLYETGSHVVTPIPHCLVHHPAINHAVRQLQEATARTGTTASSSSSSNHAAPGDLRYVQFQVERMTGLVCLTLVYHAASLKECQPSLSRLVKELTTKKKAPKPRRDDDDDDENENGEPENNNSNHKHNHNSNNTGNDNIWHSIWCHCNDSPRNNIFSRSPGRWHRLVGPEFMREPMPVARTDASTTAAAAGWLYFTPLTFRQGNLDGFEQLAVQVARAVPTGAKVCELYGGVGVLGLTTLAYHYYHQPEPLQWLRCSDENPANVRCFDRSVESLSVDMTQLDREKSNRSRKYKRTGDSGSSTESEMTIGELAQMMESGESYTNNAKRGSTKKVSYMIATAAKALKSGQALGANVLIVDPPRKGLEEEVLEELCKAHEPNQPYVESPTMLSISDDRVNWVNDVQTLIYVSCGFDALASDCDRLLSSRTAKWTLQSTTGYLLFPGSDHVETVAIFQRK